MDFELNKNNVFISPLVEIDFSGKGSFSVKIAELDSKWYYGLNYSLSLSGYASPCSTNAKSFDTKQDAIEASINKALDIFNRETNLKHTPNSDIECIEAIKLHIAEYRKKSTQLTLF